MSTSATLRYARMTVVSVLRRPFAVLGMLALPVAFYAVSHDAVGRSIRSLVFGLSWSLSTIAFFVTSFARQLEPRLVLVGWRARALHHGRTIGLMAFSLTLAAALWVLVAVDQPVRSVPAVGVDFAVTAAVAIAFGIALGTIVHSELQGALVLFFFAGLQSVADPFDAWTRLLPFWSTRELSTWAVDGPDVGSAADGLLHAIVVIGLCTIVVVLTGRGERNAQVVEPAVR
jgi:hypothetical protein